MVELTTQNQQCKFQIRAVPLPAPVTRLLDENSSLLALIEQAQGRRDDRRASVQLNDQTLDQIRQLRERLNEAFIAANGNMWNANTIDEIWSFGPQKCGTNILLNRIPHSIYKERGASIWTTALNNSQKSESNSGFTKDDYDLSIINGFQLATAKGSLCEEPLMGVAFIIERWTINTVVDHENTDEQGETTENVDADSTTAAAATTTNENPTDELESLVETISITSGELSTSNTQEKPRRVIDKSKVIHIRGPLSGQIVSTIRDGCRKAFDSQPRRLVAAMFKCETMVNAEALGKYKHQSNLLLSQFNPRSCLCRYQ